MAVSPLVTIAIPTYNRREYLQDALHSALSQSYPNIEVVVSDNSSQDGTAEVVSQIQDERLIFLRQQENLGMIGNWNACLARASGEFFLMLSDDDLLESRAIERLVRAIVDDGEPERVGVAYCRTWEVDSQGARRGLDPHPPAREEAREFALQYFLRNRKMHPCSTLLRTADLRRIGGYTQGSVVLAVDAIAWTHILLLRGAIAAVSEPLASYRIHLGRTTATTALATWRNDIRAIGEIWNGAFRGASSAVQKRFRNAVEDYESWELAALINASCESGQGKASALTSYWSCRSSFSSAVGMKNCIAGLAKLFAPEALKRPVRNLLLSRQMEATL